MTRHDELMALAGKWEGLADAARIDSNDRHNAEWARMWSTGQCSGLTQCAADLRALLDSDAFRAMVRDAWLPIESAPKDGSYVLVANFGDVAEEARWHDGSENYWREAGWYYTDSDLLTSHPCRPDVWMRKPVAPQAIDAAESGEGEK